MLSLKVVTTGSFLVGRKIKPSLIFYILETFPMHSTTYTLNILRVYSFIAAQSAQVAQPICIPLAGQLGQSGPE